MVKTKKNRQNNEIANICNHFAFIVNPRATGSEYPADQNIKALSTRDEKHDLKLEVHKYITIPACVKNKIRSNSILPMCT